MSLKEKVKQFSFKRWFKEKKVLKHYALFFGLNLIVAFVWAYVQPFFLAKLDLEPLVERGDLGTGKLWFVMLLLPLFMLLEEMAFRYSVKWVMDVTKFTNKAGKWFVPSFLVIATVWDSVSHQTNIILADWIGQLAYFAIHCVSGFYLAWIFIRKGLLASWFIHLTFNLTLFGIMFISGIA